MKKPRLWMLYAAYAAVIAGLSIWQIRSYDASFEPVQPYTHPGPAAERALPEEAPAEEETQQATRSARKPKADKPTEATETATEPTETQPETIAFPIDLNTADAEALAQIPGIGEVTARAIIDYREAHGGFRSTEEIKQVSGIKESAYAKIADKIYIGD